MSLSGIIEPLTSFTSAGVYVNVDGSLSVLTKTAQPISFYTNDTLRVTIDSTGNVGIGKISSSGIVEMQKDQAGFTAARLINLTNTGQSAHVVSSDTAQLILMTQGSSAPGTAYGGVTSNNQIVLEAQSCSNFYIGTVIAAPIIFGQNRLEVARITPNGYVMAGPGATYSVTATSHILNATTAGQEIIDLYHKGSNPNGAYMNFTAIPNNNSNWFQYFVDGAAIRAQLLSNGGLGNFSANNVNLSDGALKEAITIYTPKELDALEASFKAINWCKFKYKDQTHNDWNHGYIAQDIAKSFAQTAPELVDDDSGLGPKETKTKAVYDNDLTHIAMALLSRALKRIEVLEAKAKI